MSTLGDIENWIVSYLGRSSVADLNPVNFNPAGIDMDLGLIGINSARRLAERAHDFKYAETNVFLNITSAGAPLSSAYQNTGLTVTGTLSPNVTGSWQLIGSVSGLPLYTIIATGVQYFIYNNGAGSNEWIIGTDFNGSGGNYWILASSLPTPNGTYTAHGSNTGSPVVANATGVVGIKRVSYVNLPVKGGYEPIEFLTNDQYIARTLMQIGRQEFNPSKSLINLGVTGLPNPTAYINGQTLFLTGRYVTLPIIAQLNVTQWMPDYTDPIDTDFFTQYAPEYLQWRGLLEVNKVLKRFVQRQEGQIDEAAIQAEADAALQSLIDWDNGTVRGTTTPGAQQGPTAPAAPPQASPQPA